MGSKDVSTAEDASADRRDDASNALTADASTQMWNLEKMFMDGTGPFGSSEALDSDDENVHYVKSEFPPYKRKVLVGLFCNQCGDKKPKSYVRPNGDPRSSLSWQGMSRCVCYDCDWKFETTKNAYAEQFYNEKEEDELELMRKLFMKACGGGGCTYIR